MRLEFGPRLRRARLTTIGVAAAALMAVSQTSLAQRFERPALDVPYVPTSPDVVDRMLDAAGLTTDDFVIDLGSGDGRIAIAAAKRGALALGVDIDPQRVQEAQENAKRAGLQDKVTFVRQNLFETKLSDATVVTMYLLTKVNLDLRPRILSELKPGTRVVSHAFQMGDWQPDAHSEVGNREVFMWIVPARAAGRWRVATDAETLHLDLKQDYQYLTGRAHIGGLSIELRRGWLHGHDMKLILEDGRELEGRVEGDGMRLAFSSSKGSLWRGVRVP